ncbi:hypothetical protein DW225_01615 [Ruminococcus sp. AM18-44]|jgi:hypothetical protein|nr:hypothetical protein DW225_01615 [Ruminococcus sp. AM18-44]
MGQTKAQIVKKSLASEMSLNADAKIGKIEAVSDGREEYICQTCGKSYKRRKGNFSPSKSPIYAGTDGYLNTCKNCVDNLFTQYTEFFGGNEERAIERICQLFDFYFNESALAASKKISEDRSRISVYISKIQLKPHIGKTYSDTLLESKQNTIDSMDDTMDYGEMDSIQLKKAVSVWGFGFSPEEYSILNDMFDDWKSRVVVDGKTRETLVRELCIIKLQMNLALKDNSVDLYTKLMKTYQDTMKSANLQPLQEDANDKNGEKPIGVMIKMFENERPIQKCRPEWEDVDGIVRYITVYFLGHLCKMLKINNRYSSLYEEEMAKYRVEIPELEEADDEDVFNYILNSGGE